MRLRKISYTCSVLDKRKAELRLPSFSIRGANASVRATECQIRTNKEERTVRITFKDRGDFEDRS